MSTDRENHFLSGKRICVVGSGIAGSMFVSSLYHSWGEYLPAPKITVLEQQSRDTLLQPNPYIHTLRGGSPNDGLVAVQRLGLLDAVCARSAPNSGVIRVWSDHWKRLATIDPSPYGSLSSAARRIARHDLLRILLERAEASAASWKWKCTVTGVERFEGGKMRVTFHDEASKMTLSQDFDILIAADGINSSVLACLRPSAAELSYAGATQTGGISRLPNGVPNPVHEDYGLQMSSGDGVCCIYTPFDKETIGWAFSQKGPERAPKIGSVTDLEFESFKKEVLRAGSMFQEPFKTIVQATDRDTAFIRPAKERWVFRHSTQSTGNIVFIGDANHAINSFVQLGADLALNDGWNLATQLCRGLSFEAAVLAYDDLSYPHVVHDMEFSHERIRFGHSTGALWTLYKHGMAIQRVFKKS